MVSGINRVSFGRFLLVAFSCAFLLAGCAAEPRIPFSSMSPAPVPVATPSFYKGRSLDEIFALANNKKSWDELIHTVYSNEELKKVYWLNTSIYKIDQICPIECLRKVDEETYYSIYKSDEGDLLFLVYGVFEGEYYKTKSVWFLHSPLLVEDFSLLEMGVSTSADVRKIDPYWGDTYISGSTFLFAPFRTCHFTVDGKIVYIDYELTKESEDFIVTDVAVVDALDAEKIEELKYIDECAYRYLLPIDREALNDLAKMRK